MKKNDIYIVLLGSSVQPVKYDFQFKKKNEKMKTA